MAQEGYTTLHGEVEATTTHITYTFFFYLSFVFKLYSIHIILQ